ncbi:MAG: tetratricopeptide repeat protein [Bacteroidetes bacterium]|nr:tetratricopeptide repeat protein [Bacteroidota bacterium]
MVKKKEKAEEPIHKVEEALSRTELIIEQNQKIIYIVVGAIVVLAIIFFGYKKLYLAPKEKEAESQMFMAEKYFEKDSINLALNGDGNYLGFLNIIDDYGMTRSGNLAKYYAGVCYLRLGEFENAIDYLEKFKGKDAVVSCMALGATGDAYMEIGQTDKALDCYLRAADHNKNEFSTPMFLMKAGLTYEHLGNYAEALKLYERIKNDFRKSFEFRSIDKYIARTKGFLGKE